MIAFLNRRGPFFWFFVGSAVTKKGVRYEHIPQRDQHESLNPNIGDACNGCGEPLRLENLFMDDGCACNTPRGVNFEPLSCDICGNASCVKPGHRLSQLFGDDVAAFSRHGFSCGVREDVHAALKRQLNTARDEVVELRARAANEVAIGKQRFCDAHEALIAELNDLRARDSKSVTYGNMGAGQGGSSASGQDSTSVPTVGAVLSGDCTDAAVACGEAFVAQELTRTREVLAETEEREDTWATRAVELAGEVSALKKERDALAQKLERYEEAIAELEHGITSCASWARGFKSPSVDVIHIDSLEDCVLSACQSALKKAYAARRGEQ